MVPTDRIERSSTPCKRAVLPLNYAGIQNGGDVRIFTSIALLDGPFSPCYNCNLDYVSKPCSPGLRKMDVLCTAPFPVYKMVETSGLEPPTPASSGQRSTLELRFHNKWWAKLDLNQRQTAYKTATLTKLSYSPKKWYPVPDLNRSPRS